MNGKNYKLAKLEGINSNGDEIISLVDTLEIDIKAKTITSENVNVGESINTKTITSENVNVNNNIKTGSITSENVNVNNNIETKIINVTENVNSSKVTTDNLKSKSGSTIGSDNLNFTAPAGSEKEISFVMAENDAAHIKVGGTSNSGYLEIATKDDGSEPIYVKQYGSNSTRTATLLDDNGNTSFPGVVSAGGKTLATDESVNGVNSQVESHINNKNNPHGVTAAQVGAMPTGSAVAYKAEECTDYTSDDPTKGLTPAAAKKAVITFGVSNTGGTIDGDLKITNALTAKFFTVNSNASISSLIVNGNLIADFNNIKNNSNESLQTKLNSISSTANNAINKNDLIFELDSTTQTLTIRKNY